MRLAAIESSSKGLLRLENNVAAEPRTNVPKHKVIALKGAIFAYSPKP